MLRKGGSGARAISLKGKACSFVASFVMLATVFRLDSCTHKAPQLPLAQLPLACQRSCSCAQLRECQGGSDLLQSAQQAEQAGGHWWLRQ